MNIYRAFSNYKRTSPKEIAQLGLIAGSLMLWVENLQDPDQQILLSEDSSNHASYPQQLKLLMLWFLEPRPVSLNGHLYFPRLGISAAGFAHIYATQTGREFPGKEPQRDEEEISASLPDLDISLQAIYYEKFKDNISEENGTAEFTELQLLLGRVKYGIEKKKDDATRIVQQYEKLINRTNEYLRDMVVTSPVAGLPHLSNALISAYPYRFLQDPMKTIHHHASQLANSNESINSLLTLLSIAINDSEKKKRDRLNFSLQMAAAIIAAAALLAGLPTFFPDVNVLAIFTLLGERTIYVSHTGLIALLMLALTLFLCILWLSHMNAYSKMKQKPDLFREKVRKFWDLADHTTNQRKKEMRAKKKLPPLPLALYTLPPAQFNEDWKNGGADNIDTQATTLLQELWKSLNTSSEQKATRWSGFLVRPNKNTQYPAEDMIAQVSMLRRLIHIFVLRPALLPLPRALCILRYKSLEFLEHSTISENEFHDSLKYVSFTDEQINHLHTWLSQQENLEWIRATSVDDVANALQRAEVRAFTSKVHWSGSLRDMP